MLIDTYITRKLVVFSSKFRYWLKTSKCVKIPSNITSFIHLLADILFEVLSILLLLIGEFFK